MTISEFIRENEIRGRVTFTTDDVRRTVNLSDNTLLNELQRQVARGRIQIPYRGFYVIIPPQYALKGIVPPTYYIHELMKKVGKPYYVCLLSAAEYYGAAHQRAMVTQVMTLPPRLKHSEMNNLLNWNYRQVIPTELLLQKNVEMGVMLYSSAELTAVDLVQFASHVGGFQRAATVLAELMESVDINRLREVIPYTTTATIQRLGYLLEFVLDEQHKADELHCLLKETNPRWKTILMDNGRKRNANGESNRWHVNMNTNIEIDEL